MIVYICGITRDAKSLKNTCGGLPLLGAPASLRPRRSGIPRCDDEVLPVPGAVVNAGNRGSIAYAPHGGRAGARGAVL